MKGSQLYQHGKNKGFNLFQVKHIITNTTEKIKNMTNNYN